MTSATTGVSQSNARIVVSSILLTFILLLNP
jgi:hypothetical protein